LSKFFQAYRASRYQSVHPAGAPGPINAFRNCYTKHMERCGRAWKRIPKTVRKPLVFILGSVVVIIGVIGFALPVLPGWPLFFAGFAILATEFAFAERLRDWFVAYLKRIAKRFLRRIRN
jgi:uncharacterized protein (TIGR02611 family)